MKITILTPGPGEEEEIIVKVNELSEEAMSLLADEFPDVEFGIIGSIRGYNLIALMLELLYTAEIALDAFELVTLKSIVYLLMSICLLIIIPILKRGGKKWKV